MNRCLRCDRPLPDHTIEAGFVFGYPKDPHELILEIAVCKSCHRRYRVYARLEALRSTLVPLTCLLTCLAAVLLGVEAAIVLLEHKGVNAALEAMAACIILVPVALALLNLPVKTFLQRSLQGYVKRHPQYLPLVEAHYEPSYVVNHKLTSTA